MITIIIIPLAILFAVGAKASIENERGQIDWLLRFGFPKWAIVVLFFVLAPVVILNGCKWCVWRVRDWRASRIIKREIRRTFERVAGNHPQLQEDLKDLMDKIRKL